MVALAKATFTPATRRRLFFERAPPGANMRILAAKLGLELLWRCSAVFYGAAAGGAIAGRLSTVI